MLADAWRWSFQNMIRLLLPSLEDFIIWTYCSILDFPLVIMKHFIELGLAIESKNGTSGKWLFIILSYLNLVSVTCLKLEWGFSATHATSFLMGITFCVVMQHVVLCNRVWDSLAAWERKIFCSLSQYAYFVLDPRPF